MTVLWIAIALWAAVVINGLMRRLADWIYRPLVDIDYLDSVARLDEIIAREAVRPHGNVDLYVPEDWVKESAS